MVQVTLDEAVGRATALARAAWPMIFVDNETFRCSLIRGAEGNSDPARAIDSMCVTDLYLAQACAGGHEHALAEFDRQHIARVPVILAGHPGRRLADDVSQRLRERLLLPRGTEPPRIASYSGRGALASWVKVAALRLATNLVRGQPMREELADENMAILILRDVPELTLLEREFRQPFRAAFRAALAALPMDERTTLKLHFIDGLTVRKLAPILGVSNATAGRRLLAAQRRLADFVLAELSVQTEQPLEILESVVRVLMSKLDISLSALAQQLPRP